jgi:hypothetical protein
MAHREWVNRFGWAFLFGLVLSTALLLYWFIQAASAIGSALVTVVSLGKVAAASPPGIQTVAYFAPLTGVLGLIVYGAGRGEPELRWPRRAATLALGSLMALITCGGAVALVSRGHDRHENELLQRTRQLQLAEQQADEARRETEARRQEQLQYEAREELARKRDEALEAELRLRLQPNSHRVTRNGSKSSEP